MNRESTLPARPLAIAPTREDRPTIPILIQVPRLPAYGRPSGRWSARTAARPRRRLRRQVRWALYALVAALVPALSALAYWEGRQAALLEVRAPLVADADAEPLPPRVSLSIELALPPPPADPAPPVVFPGYLLPDDGLEEPAHARN